MSNYSDSAYDEKNTNNSWYKALELIPPKSLVLDVGCSSGSFGIELIRRKHCVVDGIELDKRDAKIAAKKLRNVSVYNIETDDLSGISTRYDVIYFGDVIEHLVDPAAALRKISALLKPAGKIVFSIPNMGHATIRLLLLKGDFDYTETGLLDKTHLHFYTQAEVYRVFAEAGYNITSIDFVQKDYPNELLGDYLKSVGLKGTKKFYDLLHQTDAAAFQFVGEASRVSKVTKPKRAQFGPIDLFESYFNNTVNPLRQQIDDLNKELALLKQCNDELEGRWRVLQRKALKRAARKLQKVYKKN